MHLSLFGAPCWRVGDAAATPLPWQRPTALLAIVGCNRDGIGRDALAALLRPDADEATARAHLRRNLNRARALVPPSALHADDRQLRWLGSCDVVAFLAAVERRDWAQAIALHAAPLLAGAGALGDAAVDAWVDGERDRLAGRLRTALVAALAAADADDGERAAWITRLAEIDLFDETALQAALEAARGPASRAAALAVTARGLRRLQDELGLAPMARTLELRARLLARDEAGDAGPALGAAPAAASQAAAVRAGPRPFAWTDTAAPLVGRVAERAALVRRLTGEGGARLVTLVGLGGTGKTRLALAAADDWAVATRGSVLRLDLRHVADGQALAGALAGAARLGAGGDSADVQVLQWAASWNTPLLLVFDNCEQFIADTAARLLPQRLVNAAPALRVLVTSREALGTPGEFRVEVGGLAADTAAALFAHHAERLGVALGDADAEAVAAIAARLLGHPLGLELAASWLPVMRPAEIVAEIDRGIAFLADDDIAHDDHRSLRAVFARSWALLSARQRAVLSALTVFAGGFDVEAARSVADARLADLLQLAGKSLLQRVPEGRFVLHPVVRQFAAREVADAAALQSRHAAHYAARVAAAKGLGLGRVDPAALAWLLRDADNVGAALRHVVAQRRFDLFEPMHRRLAALLTTSASARDMVALWGEAAAALPEGDPLRVQFELAAAGALSNMGHMDATQAMLDRIAPWLATPGERAVRHALLANVALARGDYALAVERSGAGLAEARQSPNPYVQLHALHVACGALRAVGRLDDAAELAGELLALAERHQANAYAARGQRLLSMLRGAQGRDAESQTLLAASTAFFSPLGDAFEVATNERIASFQARRRGDRQRQMAAAQASVAAMERLGVPGPHAASLYALALAQAETGDGVAAAATLRRVLSVAVRLQRVPLMLRTLGRLAVIHLDGPAAAEAQRWLGAVLARPALRNDERAEFDAALARAVPDARQRAQLVAQGAKASIEAACAAAIAIG